ncbi:DEAD/DEAH box helicase [Acetobacter fallax]|uniref:DEAD/DEAH box helicase n=1 Tax=Acetobacter fallax TaxID=1737473 RepID=A0ABX0K9M5_9PROT|nr:DEAD/DEAH box helicase [Acetobacter fallax]NHO32472.1 DEAD/DEAH box helicase [Acetobacter fallax]NHO36032.1 DEAD/DEAH box helicase [Acetobacter fallax]
MSPGSVASPSGQISTPKPDRSSSGEPGLNADLVRHAAEAGLRVLTPIQRLAIPAVLSGSDARILAPTGTGKTASYLLPLMDIMSRKKTPTALIIVPTRELARQVAEMGRLLASRPGLIPFAVYGGAHEVPAESGRGRKPKHIEPEEDAGVPPADTRIIVATPGRLLDLLRREQIDITSCRHLILDEGDRLMTSEFREEMQNIHALLPQHRQTILASATLSAESASAAQDFLHKPLHIEPESGTRPSVRQAILFVESQDKPMAAEALLRRHPDRSAIIFVTTRDEADTLTHYLRKRRLSAVVLHGRLSQPTRNAAVQDFESGKAMILVATDIAARGLDVEQVGQVINMAPPTQSDIYVHRIGRTGRAGRQGWAATLCAAAERKTMRKIESELGIKLAVLPVPALPPGTPATRPTKPQSLRRRSD